MAQASDREDRLQALYRLRESVVEKITVEDEASRAIVAAVDALIEEYEGGPPTGTVSNGAGGREAV